MKKDPLVSVIVPNYNYGRFLEERLTSILNQTYHNFEIIILDDMSTDNSKSIIEQYRKEKKVKHIIYNTQNSGSPFHQWDKGLQYAEGELVWIAESDDSCKQSFLEELVNEFVKHGDECVLCYCRSILVDIHNNQIGEKGLTGNIYLNGKIFLKKYLSRCNYIYNASGTIIRKEALNNIDKAYAQYRACGDWLFWIEISKKGFVSYIDRPLNFFRQHNNSTTPQQTKKGNSEKESQSIFLYMKEKGDINNWQLFRTKVLHMYKLKYGKLKGLLPLDVENEILKKWKPSMLVSTTLWIMHVLNKLGIKITHW